MVTKGINFSFSPFSVIKETWKCERPLGDNDKKKTDVPNYLKLVGFAFIREPKYFTHVLIMLQNFHAGFFLFSFTLWDIRESVRIKIVTHWCATPDNVILEDSNKWFVNEILLLGFVIIWLRIVRKCLELDYALWKLSIGSIYQWHKKLCKTLCQVLRKYLKMKAFIYLLAWVQHKQCVFNKINVCTRLGQSLPLLTLHQQ